MSEMPVFKNPFESNSSSEPPKKPNKSVRLNIDLDRDCNVILNYNKLLNEERARIEKRERGDRDGKTGNKKLKFSDNRYHSYAELGAGYDDEDSFIDNTDANEEGLPENMDTKFGGYYINFGDLELKKTDRHETSSSDSSDSSGTVSSSEEEVKKLPVRKEPQDLTDSKKPTSDTDVRKKAKVINVPMKEKNNSSNCLYSHPAVQFKFRPSSDFLKTT